MKDKVNKTEKMNFLAIIYSIRQSFIVKDQVQKFFEIINKNIPSSYKVPPTDGKRIESYEFTYI